MADQLRILMKETGVMSPDVPPEPSEAMPFLQDLCREYKPDLIVGHSLGGFWAQKLRGFRKALINPALEISPWLRTIKGEMKYLSPRADGVQSFMITDSMCDGFASLEAHEFDSLTQEEKDLTIAFFADADETVRHSHIFEREYGKPGISYPGGHQPVFPEMKKYIVPEILKFCGLQ